VLEQQYMEKAAIRQKEGITRPQIVAGREFKGVSFISKPETIMFKVRPDLFSIFTFVGFHCRHGTYLDDFDDERVFQFQQLQINAFGG
jgi:hypothetical protein